MSDIQPIHCAALIVAAGRGQRAGGGLAKQWRPLGRQRVIDWTIAAFRDHPRIDQVMLVVHPDDREHLPAGLAYVTGGATRAASVRAGLEALEAQGITHVLIHDAARPCVSAQTIEAVVTALASHPGAAPGVPVTDALWRCEAQRITSPHPRDGIVRAQTPQGFALPAILAAHQSADPDAPDDVSLALQAGLDLAMVPGDERNIKITTASDFDRALNILEPQMQFRIGNGYDVHAFEPGDHVTLCGLRIAHDAGLKGHSDADVGMHALTDAIYGALARGDIGQHFPPSEAQWKAADSAIFLEHARDLAAQMGYRVGNADVTLICEAPKIGPHAHAMRARLAEILQVGSDQISVKATTSEQLGFTGRREGIAAQASCLLIKE